MFKAALQTKSGNMVFDNLPPDFRNGLFNPHLKIVDFQKVNETLYKSGDLINCLYFPIDCVFSTVAVMEDGASVEIRFAGKKSVVGTEALFNSPNAHFWTNVLIAGSALKIEAQILQEIIDQNEAAKIFFLNLYLASLGQISQRAVCNGKHQLAQRLSSWLLMLFEQTGSEALPLTHDMIAQKLGARRAGITSAAGGLQAAGAIHYNRGVIHILNKKLVEQEACACFQRIKREDELLK